MATRQQIREAVYEHIETAVDGLVPPSQVSQENSNSTEALPKVVHNDAYRQVPMNNGRGPTAVQTNTDGGVTGHVHSRLIEARFSITARAEDELVKEEIYEALRTYFEKYTLPVADQSDIQADVYRVEVTDSNSNDDEDRDPIARGDTLTLNVFFERKYTRDVDPVESVDQSVDSDNDGSAEFEYTIN
jgi:hypothetical protein